MFKAIFYITTWYIDPLRAILYIKCRNKFGNFGSCGSTCFIQKSADDSAMSDTMCFLSTCKPAAASISNNRSYRSDRASLYVIQYSVIQTIP